MNGSAFRPTNPAASDWYLYALVRSTDVYKRQVIFYASVADEARVQFVAFRVGDDKLVVRRIHPRCSTKKV